jgi:aubergine
VIRTGQTLLEELLLIREAAEDRGLDYQQEVRDYIVGSNVITSYNNRVYRIDDVVFDICPENTFLLNGKKITFADYLEKRYAVKV